MSAWTWVLVAFCAAGGLLALASIVPVIAASKETAARMEALQRNQTLVLAESLQIQGDRLTRIAQRAQPVAKRAAAAVESINHSVHTGGFVPARDALGSAGADMSALYEDLR